MTSTDKALDDLKAAVAKSTTDAAGREKNRAAAGKRAAAYDLFNPRQQGR